MACIYLLNSREGPQSLDFFITTYSYPLLKEMAREQVSRTEELKGNLDQKRGEQKVSAEECQLHKVQEEWKQEERSRARHQTRRDQGKRNHKHGQGEGRNRTSSPAEALIQDLSGSFGSICQIEPPRSVGTEAGKYQNCYVQEGPREENSSSRSPAPYISEEASLRTAEDKAGRKAQRQLCRGRQPQRTTSPCGKKPHLDPEQRGKKGVAAKIQNNPEQE